MAPGGVEGRGGGKGEGGRGGGAGREGEGGRGAGREGRVWREERSKPLRGGASHLPRDDERPPAPA